MILLQKTKSKEEKINLNEEIIKMLLEIAKDKKGALIVVGNCPYDPLIRQRINPFKISDDPKLFKSLAEEDGAMILDSKGFVQAYRVKVEANKVLKGFGTRHSAGYSVSFCRNTTSYLVSEEDNLIRIFKKGKMVEIDPKKIINKKEETSAIVKILEEIGAGTLTSLSSIMVLSYSSAVISFTTIPGVIIFGGTFGGLYYLIKKYFLPFAKEAGEKNGRSKRK